ncbi:MAG: BatA domain-containing protein, partial [Verrucomicrobiales bacterium]|nr:BatA domain-containing protein [Verrucomicrobiales bacterium]
MKEELQFAYPVWIWVGLLLCGGLAYGFVIWNRRRERDLNKLAHQRLLAQLTESFSRRRRWIKQGIWLVAIFLLFVALARPQYGFEFREVEGPYSWGLNLDGLTGDEDFEHPDGHAGIDNQVYRAVCCVIGFRGPDGVEYIFQNKAILDQNY